MPRRVDPDKIEGIVGEKRNLTQHIAKAISADQSVCIMHSVECFQTNDLLHCPFTVALSVYGIDPSEWIEDVPLVVHIKDHRLVPVIEGVDWRNS